MTLLSVTEVRWLTSKRLSGQLMVQSKVWLNCCSSGRRATCLVLQALLPETLDDHDADLEGR